MTAAHDLRAAVLVELGQRPLTCRRLARRIGADSRAVSRALQALRRAGKIRQRSEPPYTHKPSGWIRWELAA